MAMNQFNKAEEAYSIALDLEPSIRRSKSFKVLLTFGILESNFICVLV